MDMMEIINSSVIAVTKGKELPVRIDAAELATQVERLIEDEYKIFQIDEGHSLEPVLAELNLNDDFLKAASQGHLQYPLEIKRKAKIETKTREYLTSHRTDIDIFSISNGYKPLISPFSGNLYKCHTSLGRDWFLINEDEQLCLVSELSQPMTFMGAEGIWVFPESKIIIWIYHGYFPTDIKKHVAQLYIRLLNNAKIASSYISDNRPRKIALTDFWCPHVCHNYWNVITGWANTLRYKEAGTIDYIVEYDNQNFYGLVSDLFPDLVQGSTCIVANSDDEAFIFNIENNILMFGVKDENISKDLTSRTLSFAKSKVSPEFINEVKEFRSSVDFLLLITIRLDNRAWLEQESGFVKLLQRVHADFPGVGLLVDGLSSDSVKGWTTGWMSLEAELSVAKSIKDQLQGQVPTIFGVGRTFFESMVLTEYADAFVAPIGSGMTIYKWITNLPGVAFSNKTALDEANVWTPLRVWDHFCEGVTPAVYLPSERVQDVETDVRDHISRANFSMSVDDLYPVVREFLIDLGLGRPG